MWSILQCFILSKLIYFLYILLILYQSNDNWLVAKISADQKRRATIPEKMPTTLFSFLNELYERYENPETYVKLTKPSNL